MSKIISIINQKGGVGKTTTAYNLGYGIAANILKQKKIKKILLIDLDPQGNLTSMSPLKKYKYSLYDFLTPTKDIPVNNIISNAIENLDIIPSDITSATLDIELSGVMGKEFLLREKIKKIKKYDYIFIDCPPSLNTLTINALLASDEVIIPVECKFLSLKGLKQLIETIQMLKKRLQCSVKISGIIATLYKSNTNMSKEIIKTLEGNFKEILYTTVIRDDTKVSEAPAMKKSIFEYCNRSNGCKDYKNLVKEFLERENDENHQ